jgi:hypothetical protein
MQARGIDRFVTLGIAPTLRRPAKERLSLKASDI